MDRLVDRSVCRHGRALAAGRLEQMRLRTSPQKPQRMARFCLASIIVFPAVVCLRHSSFLRGGGHVVADDSQAPDWTWQAGRPELNPFGG